MRRGITGKCNYLVYPWIYLGHITYMPQYYLTSCCGEGTMVQSGFIKFTTWSSSGYRCLARPNFDARQESLENEWQIQG
jgi:hypothetical protein